MLETITSMDWIYPSVEIFGLYISVLNVAKAYLASIGLLFVILQTITVYMIITKSESDPPNLKNMVDELGLGVTIFAFFIAPGPLVIMISLFFDDLHNKWRDYWFNDWKLNTWIYRKRLKGDFYKVYDGYHDRSYWITNRSPNRHEVPIKYEVHTKNKTYSYKL